MEAQAHQSPWRYGSRPASWGFTRIELFQKQKWPHERRVSLQPLAAIAAPKHSLHLFQAFLPPIGAEGRQSLMAEGGLWQRPATAPPPQPLSDAASSRLSDAASSSLRWVAETRIGEDGCAFGTGRPEAVRHVLLG